jgi:Brp/Blh family beta-carotene 15,15'-monooxygenase
MDKVQLTNKTAGLSSISMPEKLRYAAFFLGALLALAHYAMNVSPIMDVLFMAFFLLLVGIPHGAIDHLVDEEHFKIQQKPFSLIRFLAIYLIQMAIYAFCWWLFPACSLLIFLLISAWHFGETDLHPAPHHIAWALVKGVFGMSVLFFILMREPMYTADLIGRITLNNIAAVETWKFLADRSYIVFVGLLITLVTTWIWAQYIEPTRITWTKWWSFIVLLFIINFLPLLPAFALYFGAWHAWNTFGHIASFLDHKITLWRIWKKTLPFTLLAMIGLMFLGLIWWHSFSYIDPIPVLFIFIAIITLPHLRVMHRMFSQLAANTHQ